MDGIHHVSMGDRGRLVVPLAVRDRMGLHDGDPLVLVESPTGLVLLTRQQLKDRVREELTGPSLVDELLDERRRAASDEDAA